MDLRLCPCSEGIVKMDLGGYIDAEEVRSGRRRLSRLRLKPCKNRRVCSLKQSLAPAIRQAFVFPHISTTVTCRSLKSLVALNILSKSCNSSLRYTICHLRGLHKCSRTAILTLDHARPYSAMHGGPLWPLQRNAGHHTPAVSTDLQVCPPSHTAARPSTFLVRDGVWTAEAL